MTLQIFEKNTVIFRQGDMGDTFYVILTGSCEIRILKEVKEDMISEMTEEEKSQLLPSKNDPSIFLKEIVIVNLGAGQFFGERALDSGEPRAATVIATAHTELLCVTREAYRRILRTEKEAFSQTFHSGTKARIIRVLSKPVEMRSSSELEDVSSYLRKNVTFFKQFTHEQRLEICRMAELVVIFGKTILFKQGDIGQAFYVILTGSVSVLVNVAKNSLIDSTSDTTDVKAEFINELYEGQSFGERALESANSTRTATVVSSEKVTELFVISKEIYRKFIGSLRSKVLNDKIALLKRTHCFAQLEEEHLREIARYMEPKVYRMGEAVRYPTHILI